MAESSSEKSDDSRGPDAFSFVVLGCFSAVLVFTLLHVILMKAFRKDTYMLVGVYHVILQIVVALTWLILVMITVGANSAGKCGFVAEMMATTVGRTLFLAVVVDQVLRVQSLSSQDPDSFRFHRLVIALVTAIYALFMILVRIKTLRTASAQHSLGTSACVVPWLWGVGMLLFNSVQLALIHVHGSVLASLFRISKRRTYRFIVAEMCAGVLWLSITNLTVSTRERAHTSMAVVAVTLVVSSWFSITTWRISYNLCLINAQQRDFLGAPENDDTPAPEVEDAENAAEEEGDAQAPPSMMARVRSMLSWRPRADRSKYVLLGKKAEKELNGGEEEERMNTGLPSDDSLHGELSDIMRAEDVRTTLRKLDNDLDDAEQGKRGDGQNGVARKDSAADAEADDEEST